MLSEWATRRQPKTTYQEETVTTRFKAPTWDADDWINLAVAAAVAFAITWAALDVSTCLAAYEAMGPKMAAAYNPQCA